MTIPQQTQICDLKHVDCSPKQIINNSNGGGEEKDVNVIIPLNRYSFFEELEDKMLVPIVTCWNNQEMSANKA